MFCATCGQVIAEGTRVCGNCGAASAPTGSGDAATGEPAPADTASAPPPAPSYAASAASAAAGSTNTLISRLVDRVKAILLTPKTEWPVIAGEATTPSDIYLRYVAPLVAIGVIASFLGGTVIGVSIPLLGTLRTGIGAGLAAAILHFVLTFVGVFVVAWIVNALAPTFGGQKDSLRALKVTAYSFTPAWVAAVLTIIPALGIIAGLIGLYALYLMYLGLPVLMRSPADKSLGYTVVVVICAIVLSIVISLVSGLAIGSFGARGSGMLGSADTDRAAATASAAATLSKALGGKSDADAARVNGALSTLQKLGADADRAERTAKAAGKDPDAAAANAVDLGKAMAAVGSMMTGGKQVQPLDFHALKDLLPATLLGMPRSNASGQSGGAMGMQGSSASADYGDGANAHITLEIADIGSMSGLAGLATRFDPNMEKETDTGYERTRKVDGQLVHEQYDRKSRNGEASVLIDNRISISAHGSGVDGGALASALKTVDLGKLTKLAAAAK